MSPVHNEDGKTYPGKRFNKKPPRQPSPEELKRMPINQIADLIRETRNYYWPHEAGEKKK